MTILRDVVAELMSMFLGDARQSLAMLAVVVVAAALSRAHLPGLVIGAVLLAGAVGVLALSVWRAAARLRAARRP